MNTNKSKKIKDQSFDKYLYYLSSVQSPDSDVEFMADTYYALKGRAATILREDFCGTFSTCSAWVQLDESKRAIGIDLDPEPLGWGYNHLLPNLTDDQKSRLQIIEGDVLRPHDIGGADIVCALNFSYFGFKDRDVLKHYFMRCRENLNDDGVLILDCFGGSQCYEANEEETIDEEEGYSYFWDQDSYNPVTGEAQFYIHFRRNGEKRRERVFSYDWRLWSLPELRDLLKEAGFRSSHIYWEGTDEDGSGNGEFTPTTEGEECESWIAYIVAEK